MGVNKVVYGEVPLIDLTQDTIRADKLSAGITAHGPDGEIITGTLKTAPMVAYAEDYNGGYVSNDTWKYDITTDRYADVYRVTGGHRYFFTLGATVSNRFRSIFTTQDITQATSNVTGISITNQNSPEAYSNGTYTAETDGYIVISKDINGRSGIKTYMYDATSGWL